MLRRRLPRAACTRCRPGLRRRLVHGRPAVVLAAAAAGAAVVVPVGAAVVPPAGAAIDAGGRTRCDCRRRRLYAATPRSTGRLRRGQRRRGRRWGRRAWADPPGAHRRRPAAAPAAATSCRRTVSTSSGPGTPYRAASPARWPDFSWSAFR